MISLQFQKTFDLESYTFALSRLDSKLTFKVGANQSNIQQQSTFSSLAGLNVKTLLVFLNSYPHQPSTIYGIAASSIHS